MKAALGLGTVQFGLDYGISNTTGKVQADGVGQLLDQSSKLNIDVLDTAFLYGDSQRVLGEQNLTPFKVVTKTPHFKQSRINMDHVNTLTTCFHESLKMLHLRSVYGLLVHNAGDLLVPGGEKLFESMQTLKSKGFVKRIGASIYDGEQVDLLLERYDVDIIQVPMNVLDQRLIDDGQMSRLKEKNVEVHVRSVFLQGLLLMDLNKVPEYFTPILPLLKRWHMAAKEQGFTLLQAALSFARDAVGVDVVLVGVENMQQLNDCTDAFYMDRCFDATGLGSRDTRFVNPAKWQVV